MVAGMGISDSGTTILVGSSPSVISPEQRTSEPQSPWPFQESL